MTGVPESSGAQHGSRSVTLLGSTGSIGTQAIDVIQANPGRFRVDALSAGGGQVGLIARQAIELGVSLVAIADEERRDALVAALETVARDSAPSGSRRMPFPEIVAGPEASSIAAAFGSDTVLNGITGSIGLAPTLAALRAGSTLALANKESLIVGGALVLDLAADEQIVPVDSEHSAIAQCLRSGSQGEVGRIVVTASGGPFRGFDRARLAAVTPEQALAHPNFAMGKVITTNSATLVNKGLEVIEAHLLFGVPFESIDVVVHPQQFIHSMVEFVDGATIAQASPPSMLIPIALGLSWPDRLPHAGPPIDWTNAARWDFEPLDEQVFTAVALARSAGQRGGIAPAVFNAANEEAVEAFHAGALGFVGIVDLVADVLAAASATDELGTPKNLTLEAVLAAEDWARSQARTAISRL